MKRVVFAGVLFALVAAPLTAQAQGVPGGAAHGFHEGNRIAGPVGAVVGTAVGGVIGGVEGVLGVRPAAYSQDADVPPPRAYTPAQGQALQDQARAAATPSPAPRLCELITCMRPVLHRCGPIWCCMPVKAVSR